MDTEFLDWAELHGIGLDLQYAPPQSLVYRSAQTSCLYWNFPPEPSDIPAYLSRLLEFLDPWDSCMLWKRGGIWNPGRRRLYDLRGELAQEEVLGVNLDMRSSVWAGLLYGLGVTEGFRGALRFDRSELHLLIGICFVQMCFGWGGTDDLCVVPDHGKQIVTAEHHKVLRIDFFDEARASRFAAEAEAIGMPTVDQMPDETLE